MQLPATLGSGDHAVVASVAGVSSQSGALLKITATTGQLTNRKRAPAALLAARAKGSRPFLPFSRRRRAGLEEIVSLRALFGPGQHPDSGATLARRFDHHGALILLG